MSTQVTPFKQLDAIFETYPTWLRPTYFVVAFLALALPYLLPAELPSILRLALIPVGFLCFMAALSFLWLCIAEIVVRTLNRWGAGRPGEISNG